MRSSICRMLSVPVLITIVVTAGAPSAASRQGSPGAPSRQGPLAPDEGGTVLNSDSSDLIVQLKPEQAISSIVTCLREGGVAARWNPIFPPSKQDLVGAERLERFYRLSFESKRDSLRAGAHFKSHSCVSTCSEAKGKLIYLVNDPYFVSSGSWGQSYPDQWSLKNINIESAWYSSVGSSTLTIAVLDSGVDYNHVELQGRLWVNPAEDLNHNGKLDPWPSTQQQNGVYGDLDGIDNDGNGYKDDVHGLHFSKLQEDELRSTNTAWDVQDTVGHGTHVAGVIGARTNNGLGMAGINWNSKLMVLGINPDPAYLSKAIHYAVNNGAKVINASWTVLGRTPVVEEALLYAYSNGVVIVAASGNFAQEAEFLYPQSDAHTILVNAVDPFDAPTFFTNFGARTDVAAPGGGPLGPPSNPLDSVRAVLSLLAAGVSTEKLPPVGTLLARGAGTSFAAPHVTGVVSLIRSRVPSLTIEQVRQALRLGAYDVDADGWDPYFGFGRLDAATSLMKAKVSLGEARILSPESLTNMRSGVPITIQGTAWAPDFTRYELQLGAGTKPSSWEVIGQGTASVRNGVLLSSWNPGSRALGAYQLRLLVYSGSGTVYEDRMSLKSEVPYHPGFDPAVQVPKAGLLGEFGPPVAGDVDGDGQPEIVETGGQFSFQLSIFSANGVLKRAIVFPQVPGTPARLHVGGGAALGELDRSRPGLEIVYLTTYEIAAIHGDGSTFGSWPVPLQMPASSTARPMVADLDGDGTLEVVALVPANSTWEVRVYSSSGAFRWSQASSGLLHDAAAADLNLDGKAEVVLFPAVGTVGVYNNLGVLQRSRQVAPTGVTGIHRLVLGDLTGDRRLEIVMGMFDQVLYKWQLWLLDSDLNTLPGWPQTVQNDSLTKSLQTASGFLAIGDIDGNLLPDIVTSAGDLVFALKADGSLINNLIPIPLVSLDQPFILGDVSGDGHMDVVGATIFGGVVAYDWLRRANLPGWPLLPEEGLPAAPMLADIDRNGQLELAVFTQDFNTDFAGTDPGRLNVWDAAGRGPAPWPVAHGGPGRTNAFVVKRGDADRNGVLEDADATFLLNFLFLEDGAYPADLISADANGDGRVDISDPQYIQNYLHQGGPAPPP